MRIRKYLDPSSSPIARPPLECMAEATQSLHESIDQATKRCGIPYLHPEGPSIQLDLLGSQRMTQWQEDKAQLMFTAAGCWSELPQVYSRYGAEFTRRLIGEVRTLEGAAGAIVTDSGMGACALLFDVLVRNGSHSVFSRQLYNKTRHYLDWLSNQVAASITIVDENDYEGLERAVCQDTTLLFVETYSNPLLRAVDPARLGSLVERCRNEGAHKLVAIVDNTVASPWGLKSSLLTFPGIDVVVASGTKALGGQDRDMWGYIASDRIDLLNEVMDLQAMRGGILDWRRAEAILAGLPAAQEHFSSRCSSASTVAQFLHQHPRVSTVFHPALQDHPDKEAVSRYYDLPGSLLSFRIRGASEEDTKHFADVLATCTVLRYALSFDGLCTKVNHHRTVSEYFTPEEELKRSGFDRLIRLGIGVEAPQDIMACLNWALWHFEEVTPDEVVEWQEQREKALGICRKRQPR